MLQKTITLSLIMAVSLSAFNGFGLSLNDELQRNSELIKEYTKRIKSLEQRNKFLLKEKEKNPKLYEDKSLYEETKHSYIHRVKLNGAKANQINFTIKNNLLSMEMNIKNETKTDSRYYSTSRYFSQTYTIPKNVDQTKIKHEIDGDYFVVIMPKK